MNYDEPEQDNNIFSEVFKIPESSTLNYNEKKDPKKKFFNLLNKKFGFVLTRSDNAYKIFKGRTMFVRKLNSKYSPGKKNNNYVSLSVIDNDDIEFVEEKEKEEKTTKKGKTKKIVIPQIKSNVENGYYKSFEFDFTNLKNPNYEETRKKIIYSLEYGTTENLKTNRNLTVKLINDMDIIPSSFSFDNYGKVGDEIEDDDIENEKPISDAVLEDKEETPIEPKEEGEIERMDPEEEIEDSPKSPESPKIKGKIPKILRLTDDYNSYQNDSDNDSDDNSDDDYSDFEDSIYSNPSPTFGSSKNEFDDFFDSKGFMKLKGPDIFFFSTSKDGTQLISKFAFDKAKGQPINSNNNNSQDSLLKLIVRASQDNKGEVDFKEIGEIQDLNGEITKLYSDMQQLKSEINLSNKKRDFARRDKLIIKYNKKKLKLEDLIKKYSKEAYRLSTLKKKKATMATHKYLMNKLNKLK